MLAARGSRVLHRACRWLWVSWRKTRGRTHASIRIAMTMLRVICARGAWVALSVHAYGVVRRAWMLKVVFRSKQNAHFHMLGLCWKPFGASWGYLGLSLASWGQLWGHLGPTWGRRGGGLGCSKWRSGRGETRSFIAWNPLGAPWGYFGLSIWRCGCFLGSLIVTTAC